MSAGGASSRGPVIHWRVVERHLDELGSEVARLDRAFESPLLTIESLAERHEPRLLAHLDALRIGGAPIQERLLAPRLLKPDPEAPEQTTAAAMVAVVSGKLAELLPVLGHPADAVREAVARGCALAGDASLDRWMRERVQARGAPREQGTLLAMMVTRGQPVPVLVAYLQGDDLALTRGAAQAARAADAERHRPVVEYLLEHPDAAVREAALIAALSWRSPRAFGLCEQWPSTPPS